ncbi:histidine phosphatase family protein [Pseudomarimonas arenosa]|uniref:Histidine phosphatase family protein n=1 Tax=Pseudomarimonas arenosa TaxID=2774145 RepID=A0AAW3ZNV6_9GAMM|nr:histidine phosphatase family protein [Pseudomarimonas arenosa]MBD8527653.1 histidine phosphatase family protein [Pseudomarimonas arenosa]
MFLAPVAVAESTSARVIWLVRHGHYLPDASADPKLGPGISPLGVAQAHLVGDRLAQFPQTFDARYVSPLQRARDTAAVMGQSLSGATFEVVSDLAECTPPTRRQAITEQMPESELIACQQQLDRLFETYFKPGGDAAQRNLMVCHGNVIRYLITRALGVDKQAWLEMSVGHASLTQIRIEADGSYKVIAAGDVGHLTPSLLTGASGDPERGLAVPKLPVQGAQ